MSQLCKSAQYAYRSENLFRLNMHPQRSIPKQDTKNYPLQFAFSKIHRTWSFHAVVLQRTAKKCTKIQNARAQLLLCSLNLLFGEVLVAVAVVVCLNSLVFPAPTATAVHRLRNTWSSLLFQLVDNYGDNSADNHILSTSQIQ